ncbi:penicillin-binding protein 2 [Parvularcula dongshanensis]|uniref:Penicillin-binding protein 2 n=1 Tax=Parvularcula dongshanensis TaxID=1173995 RepID=A0A840I5D5_9PROT|nr:penicillin-binding protein 2 [Parvularcula dongshanensis]MBB4659535.1 penicillin-binding protein 2 [Parvularcula dongshanensis]
MRVEPFDTQRAMIFNRRALIVAGGAFGLFGGVGARLYHLQVRAHDDYAALADDNQFNQRVVVPLRGEILDRYGHLVATNAQDFRVVLIPERTGSVAQSLARLEQIVPLTEAQRARVLRDVQRQTAFTPIQVAQGLTWDQFAAINYRADELPGIQPEVGMARSYPDAGAVAFVTGYVGSATDRDLEAAPDEETKLLYRQPGFKLGKAGLEHTFDDGLRGEQGSMTVQVNAHGRVIEEIANKGHAPAQGESLGLTIDTELQRHTLEVLGRDYGEYPEDVEHHTSASAVVIDAWTGDVVVMASAPAYDPNDFTSGIPASLWRDLNASPLKPLLNKPVAGAYPPGSTFKTITAIAAQEAGIAPSTRFHCSGVFNFAGNPFRCWKRGGHGSLAMEDSLKHSCDVYYFNLATKLDIDHIADVARRYGLGQTYDLGIGAEAKGTIPDRAWKAAYYRSTPANQKWFAGETLSVAIGQGAVTATPLQLAVMAARLATGNAVTPRLVRTEGEEVIAPPSFARVSGDTDDLDVVRAGMNAVVNEWGTAARSSLQPDWMMAGKTGTSQVRSLTRDPVTGRVLSNDELPWSHRDHALFVCFAPYDSPRYAAAVVVEHGGSGSKSAGPRARDIMRAVLEKDPGNTDRHRLWRPGMKPLRPGLQTASLGAF